MPRLTNHARERIRLLAPVIGRGPMQALLNRLAAAPNRGDIAIVSALGFETNDPNRVQGSPCDHIAAVVRNGRIVSVMLTRESQLTRQHFRVNIVLQ